MATLATIRSEINTAVNTIANLHVYSEPVDRIDTPSFMIVGIETARPRTFGPNGWEWPMVCQLLVSRPDLRSATRELDAYVSSTGTRSITQAIQAGTFTNASVVVAEIRDYGGFIHSGANYLGTEFLIEVITSD